MTNNERQPLRISMATLGLLLMNALCADRVFAQDPWACTATTDCVPMTFNANVQLTKLHPLVTHVELECRAPGFKTNPTGTSGVMLTGKSAQIPVVNRGYSGVLTATINVQRWLLDNPVNRTINATCYLRVRKAPGTSGYDWAGLNPVAAQPETITADNWGHFAPGAVGTWTQAVTFPNAEAP